MITAKDVRTLERSARLVNSVTPGHALVWRAVVERVEGLPKNVERWFLPDENPTHISWWISGARDACESLGYKLQDEELSIERV